MKETTAIREVQVTRYEFEASRGDYNESLTIENGEIVETGCWDSRNGGGSKKGESDFIQSCEGTIRFIVKQKPEELKNIYHKLSEGRMKEFCRRLQKEKMKELEF